MLLHFWDARIAMQFFACGALDPAQVFCKL